MTGLAIPLHSRRLNGLAVLVLTLLAAGSFAVGLARQVGGVGPSPFPASQESSPAALAAGSPPDVTPAPAVEVAAGMPPPRRSAPPAAAPPADAAPPPAADASATAPEQTPAPAPDATPDTPAPPT